MDDLNLQQLLTQFGSEKRYLSDGYYRIRSISDEEVEMAFLIADACGATTVNPQITIKKIGKKWQPVKYLNMAVSPTQSFILDDQNSQFLNQELEKLIKKFEDKVSK